MSEVVRGSRLTLEDSLGRPTLYTLEAVSHRSGTEGDKRIRSRACLQLSRLAKDLGIHPHSNPISLASMIIVGLAILRITQRRVGSQGSPTTL